MSSRLRLVLCLATALSATALRAETATVPAPTPAATPTAPSATELADRDYAAFKEVESSRPPQTGGVRLSRDAYFRWVDATLQKVGTLGLSFYENYPNDPRRWEVASEILRQRPLFAKSIGADVETKGMAAIVVDEEAKAAWDAKLATVQHDLLAAKDVPADIREGVEWSLFAKDFRASTAAMRAGKTVDWSLFRERFDAHVAKYPDTDLSNRASDYLGALEHNVPGASAAEWKHLAETSRNEGVRATAEKRAHVAELLSKPLELKFTALDGREVDLRKLRGKVVLVDFWATWCGPCKEEIPNVKRVYAAYHDKGFEIVGVALDREADRQKLADFVKENEMPWPQYFDGKWWKTAVAQQYQIEAIPAMFLLGKDGKVVSTNARGPALEEEVKKQLAL